MLTRHRLPTGRVAHLLAATDGEMPTAACGVWGWASSWTADGLTAAMPTCPRCAQRTLPC